MSRSFLVPILLPADPTVALEAATKQYVDAQGGGTGDQYQYDWSTNTTAADPGTGKVKCNNADPSLATAVYISMVTDLGRAAIFLLDLAVGSRFAMYEQGDINTFIRYEVTGTPTNNGPNVWFSVPVTVHEEGAAGFTPTNNQTLQVGPSRGAVAGGGTDEVWIGTTAPTDPNIELWYDPDATPTATSSCWPIIAQATEPVAADYGEASIPVGAIWVEMP